VECGGEDGRRATEKALPNIVMRIQWLRIFNGSQKQIPPSKHGTSRRQEIERNKVSK
jgi:hypothetical protein